MITPDETAPSGEPQVDSARRRRLGPLASRSWPTAILALLCYVPALLAYPGRLPADTKLYLYLDPGGLMRAAPRAWDATQYGGWVPHQTISYLWPSGPWYWIFDKFGVPDWIAQRLWIATLLLCAGLGARWLAKMLGLKPAAAMVTALFYMLSPYILPYISRTSLMLLPFSGLCWLIGLTIKAATGSSWRAPALFALVMFTVAAPNFTAIVMVAPGPILWLVDAVWRRTIPFKAAALTTAKLGLLSLVVSLWWVVMLSIQSKHGANVLGFSETLQAVSLTSLSTETLRGLGYWLFYIRDLGGPATSAATAYLTSSALVLVTLVVLIGGFAGLTIVRWGARRYAALLVLAGTILAVSVHPIDAASPLMSPLADASRSGLALSMRSSTRALPLSVLGFALGWGALVTVLSSATLRCALADALADALANGCCADSRRAAGGCQPSGAVHRRYRRPGNLAHREPAQRMDVSRYGTLAHREERTRAATARCTVRRLPLGLYRRSGDARFDGQAVPRSRSAATRQSGGNGSAVCHRQPFPERNGRSCLHRPSRPAIRC